MSIRNYFLKSIFPSFIDQFLSQNSNTADFTNRSSWQYWALQIMNVHIKTKMVDVYKSVYMQLIRVEVAKNPPSQGK